MLTIILLAQSNDPLSGGGGWVGAGLLGAVLAWLLFVNLPAKDKQLREIISENIKAVHDVSEKQSSAIKDAAEKQSVAINATSDKQDKLIRELTSIFRDEARAERVACEGHFGQLANAMAKGNEASMAAFRTLSEQMLGHSQRNQQWSDLLKQKTLELQDLQRKVEPYSTREVP